MMKTLYESKITRIQYDQERKLIFFYLLGVIDHENYKIMWNTLLEKVIEVGVQKMVVDQSQMDRSSMESKAWLVTQWLPRARKRIGEEVRIAVVSSKNLFTKIGGEYIANAARKMTSFDIKFTSNTEEAISWLMDERDSSRH